MDELIGFLGRWASGRGPLYLLLAVRLRALIDDGVLPPGTPLPPDRALAQRLAVGRGTVIAAYDLLQQEGRLVRRQGSGTRVAGPALPAIRAAADGLVNPLTLHILDRPDGVTLLSCAAPLEPPPELAEACASAAARLARIRDDIGYHPAGIPSLRSALADYYSARGLRTSPDEILVTNGGQQAVTLITNLVVSPGDVVRAEAPTYPGALEIFRNAGARIEGHPLGTLPSGDGRLAYVIPTAHNPTGVIMPATDRRRLSAWAGDNDVPLIDDEVPAELCFDGETPPPLAAYGRSGHILTVGSLSKLVWGGIRIGWIRAAAPVIARLARLRAIHDLGGDVITQLAAVELLARLDPVRLSRQAVLKARHDHLCALLRERLPEWSFEPALGGQTIWVRLPRGDAGTFAQVTARHGVAVPPGPAFDPAGGHTDYLRLPFLHPEPELTDAVTRIAAAWRDYDGTRRPASLHPMVV